jgi:hypothetical protein
MNIFKYISLFFLKVLIIINGLIYKLLYVEWPALPKVNWTQSAGRPGLAFSEESPHEAACAKHSAKLAN